MRPLRETVSENIKALRIRGGWSQQALANRTGLSVRYISKVENDPPDITLHNLQIISKGLKVRVAELVDDGSIRPSSLSKKEKDAISATLKILNSLVK